MPILEPADVSVFQREIPDIKQMKVVFSQVGYELHSLNSDLHNVSPKTLPEGYPLVCKTAGLPQAIASINGANILTFTRTTNPVMLAHQEIIRDHLISYLSSYDPFDANNYR
jgi:hypothetical protein